MKLSSLRRVFVFVLSNLLIFLSGFFVPTGLMAQTKDKKTVTLSLRTATVANIISEVQSQTDYTFSYVKQYAGLNKTVTLEKTTYTIDELVPELIAQTGLRFWRKNNVIIVREKKKGTVKGKVRTSDGKFAAGVSVQLQNTGMGTFTKDDGSFSLTAPEGRYSLTASYTGFGAQVKNITVKREGSTDVDFTLVESSNQLRDVAIKSYDLDHSNKLEVTQLKQSGFSVNAIDLRQYSNMSLDLNQVLARTTGVIIRENGGLGSDYQFYINGLTGEHIRFFLDGIPLENLGTTFNLNNIPVNFAKRIEVYKGVVPAELGSDALGGAVNIITDQSIHRFIDASYSYGSFNTHRASVNARFINPKTGLIINFNGFYNYSDNDYWMRNNSKYNVLLEVTKDGQYVQTDKIRRFYDRYKSGMGNFEIGYSNKKWADLATIGVNVSANNKEIQTGATLNAVYGGFYTTDNDIVPELRYKKKNFLVKGLDQYLDATASFDKNWVHDTAKYEYDWSGKWIEPLGLHKQEDMEYTIRNQNIKDNWNYRLDKHSNFSLNYTLDRNQRTDYNHLLSSDASANLVPTNTVTKHVGGLAYQGNFFKDKLLTTLMLKYYGLNVVSVQDSLKPVTGDEGQTVYKNIPGARTAAYHGYWSYAANARWLFAKNSGIKASYEKGYRLPALGELFGDGVSVEANPRLSPEKSDNYNVGFFAEKTYSKHRINLEGNFYVRNSKNYIYSTPVNAQYVQYKNIGTAYVKGLDAEATYTYGELFHLMANFSYQDMIDNQKYVGGAASEISITYKSRIPNTPWMYGNLDFGIGKNDLFGKRSRIEFNWHSQYTHWFYLTWSNLGAKDTKDVIPSQWIHSPAVTYSWESGKYNVSVESLNVTNALVYDNYRLQKPGRSFNIKFRIFFM